LSATISHPPVRNATMALDKKLYLFGSYFLFTIVAIALILLTWFVMTLVLRFFHIRGLPDKRYDWSLHNDGIQRIKGVLTQHDLNQLRHLAETDQTLKMQEYLLHPQSSLSRHVMPLLPEGYVFHDYIFFIRRSQFHTCHRDYNGDLFNEGIHPSYTMIVYLSDMDRCLDVIPGSHTSKDDNMGLTDRTQTVHCLTGDVLLFNANIVHSGSLNEGAFPRVQLKVSHRDDLEKLAYYQGYHKVMNEEMGYSTALQNLHKHLTCTFPIISEWTKGYDNNKDAAKGTTKGTTKSDADKSVEKEQSLISTFYAKLDEAK
jgi:hypothetical protein